MAQENMICIKIHFILSSFVLPYTFHGEITRFADNDGKNKRKCLDVLLFFSTFAINC